MNFLPKNLKYLREQRKVTQAEMAAQLGFPRTTWATYEKGGSTPSLDEILGIAKHFGLSLDEIIARDLSEGNLISVEDPMTYQQKGNLKGDPDADLPTILAVSEPDIPLSDARMNVYDLESRTAASKVLLLISGDKAKPAPNMYLPGLGPGIHIRIPIAGDSMEALFGDGDKIVATHIATFKEIREGQPHIVIDAEEGVVFKRLYHAGPETIEFVSDNSLYKPYQRGFSDILAIFKYREHHSGRTEPSDIAMRRELRELREELAAIWERIGR